MSAVWGLISSRKTGWEARALQKSRRWCEYSPQRLHVAYLELQIHTAVIAVVRCVALDWADDG